MRTIQPIQSGPNSPLLVLNSVDPGADGQRSIAPMQDELWLPGDRVFLRVSSPGPLMLSEASGAGGEWGPGSHPK